MSSSPPPAPAGRPSRWPHAVAVMFLSLCGLAGFVFYQMKALPGDLIEHSGSLLSGAQSVAEAFRHGTVTTRFISYAAEMSGQSRLQFATLKQTEVFERTDRQTVLWGQLALPDVVVRAEAPVEYTYYLDLEEPWELLLEGHRILVRAPPIRFGSPAIDVSRVRYDVAEGSVLRDEEKALDNLRKGISTLAKRRAAENVALVRELGRKKTAEFIRTWLLASYADAESYRIEVVFADELDTARPRDLPLAHHGARP